jgi:hypothetical protein
LVAQHPDLDILGAITPAAQHEDVEHQANKPEETRHISILAGPERRRSLQRELPGHRRGQVFGTDTLRATRRNGVR